MPAAQLLRSLALSAIATLIGSFIAPRAIATQFVDADRVSDGMARVNPQSQ